MTGRHGLRPNLRMHVHTGTPQAVFNYAEVWVFPSLLDRRGSSTE